MIFNRIQWKVNLGFCFYNRPQNGITVNYYGLKMKKAAESGFFAYNKEKLFSVFYNNPT